LAPFSLPKQAHSKEFKKTLMLAENRTATYGTGRRSDADALRLFDWKGCLFKARIGTGMPRHVCFYFNCQYKEKMSKNRVACNRSEQYNLPIERRSI